MTQNNDARWGPGALKAGQLYQADNTPRSRNLQRAACRALEAGLLYLPHPADMATILRSRLDLAARIWLTASGMISLPEDSAEAMSRATLADIDRHRLTPHEIEVDRQRTAWVAHCARRTPFERRRRGRR